MKVLHETVAISGTGCRFALSFDRVKRHLCFIAGLLAAVSASANVTITGATGGSAISADKTGGAWTTLTGPVATEGNISDIDANGNSGTIVLTAPTGFIFNTAVTVSVIVTGGPNQSHNINDLVSGGKITATVTSNTITVTINDHSDDVPNTLTWTNIQVRPTNGTPLASGTIAKSGTCTMVSPSGSWGTLTEVAGAANKIAITTQPSATAIAGAAFAQQPVVAIKDQFGNVRTSDTSIVNVSMASGTGILQGTTNISAAGCDSK